ncbi:MAG: hypothetical protein AAGC53_09860 [Actinomycetota bacterium]
MFELEPHEVIDHDRYPVAVTGPARDRIVADVRDSLADDGCAVLPGFLSENGHARLLAEALEREPRAFYNPKNQANVHLGDPDPGLPDRHPRNRFFPRTNGFVRADEWARTTTSKRLYDWPPLKDFLQDCLGKDELHTYDDPVSNMIVNVQRTGQEFNWHFDTNEFTITMLLQAADDGGHFEYVPDLRSPTDENEDGVNAILDGERTGVRTLDLQPGDLQFFLGRFSLHRVTPNLGATTRLLLIMSFSEASGSVGSVQRIRSLYGKVTEEHLTAAAAPVRADALLD